MLNERCEEDDWFCSLAVLDPIVGHTRDVLRALHLELFLAQAIGLRFHQPEMNIVQVTSNCKDVSNLLRLSAVRAPL